MGGHRQRAEAPEGSPIRALACDAGGSSQASPKGPCANGRIPSTRAIDRHASAGHPASGRHRVDDRHRDRRTIAVPRLHRRATPALLRQNLGRGRDSLDLPSCCGLNTILKQVVRGPPLCRRQYCIEPPERRYKPIKRSHMQASESAIGFQYLNSVHVLNPRGTFLVKSLH